MITLDLAKISDNQGIFFIICVYLSDFAYSVVTVNCVVMNHIL